jgi:hypothetical protein
MRQLAADQFVGRSVLYLAPSLPIGRPIRRLVHAANLFHIIKLTRLNRMQQIVLYR